MGDNDEWMLIRGSLVTFRDLSEHWSSKILDKQKRKQAPKAEIHHDIHPQVNPPLQSNALGLILREKQESKPVPVAFGPDLEFTHKKIVWPW